MKAETGQSASRDIEGQDVRALPSQRCSAAVADLVPTRAALGSGCQAWDNIKVIGRDRAGLGRFQHGIQGFKPGR